MNGGDKTNINSNNNNGELFIFEFPSVPAAAAAAAASAAPSPLTPPSLPRVSVGCRPAAEAAAPPFLSTFFLLFSSRFLSSLYDTQGEKEDDTGVAGGYDEVLEEIESSGGGVAGGGEEKGESPVAE